MATLWVEYGNIMGRVWLPLAKSLPTPWELLAITLPKGNRKLSTLSSRKMENCQPKAAGKTEGTLTVEGNGRAIVRQWEGNPSEKPFLCKRYAVSLPTTSLFTQKGITNGLNQLRPNCSKNASLTPVFRIQADRFAPKHPPTDK